GDVVFVDAGGGEQRRHDVDVRGRGTVDHGADRGAVPDPGDRERHPGRLVVQVEPLLVEAAVRAEQVAVVGGAHDDGVCRAGTVELAGDRTADPVDRPVHLG